MARRNHKGSNGHKKPSGLPAYFLSATRSNIKAAIRRQFNREMHKELNAPEYNRMCGCPFVQDDKGIWKKDNCACTPESITQALMERERLLAQMATEMEDEPMGLMGGQGTGGGGAPSMPHLHHHATATKVDRKKAAQRRTARRRIQKSSRRGNR